MNTKLTADQVRGLLNYDPDTGVLTWVDRHHTKAPGSVAGSVDRLGYVMVFFLRGRWLGHRLAWLHMTGEWPSKNIDHINGVRSDNRWANLRDVPQQMNCENQRLIRPSNKSSGLLGATWHSRCKRWMAQIKTNGQQIHIGYFDTAEQAHEAYIKEKARIHKGFVTTCEGAKP